MNRKTMLLCLTVLLVTGCYGPKGIVVMNVSCTGSPQSCARPPKPGTDTTVTITVDSNGVPQSVSPAQLDNVCPQDPDVTYVISGKQVPFHVIFPGDDWPGTGPVRTASTDVAGKQQFSFNQITPANAGTCYPYSIFVKPDSASGITGGVIDPVIILDK